MNEDFIQGGRYQDSTVLDECYVTAKTDIYKCCNLPPLGTSDHDAVMMIPRYSPACRSQPIYISRQIWSNDNIEKLIDRLDDTDWSVILSDSDTIHEQTTAFSDYLSFCIDVCMYSNCKCLKQVG